MKCDNAPLPNLCSVFHYFSFLDVFDDAAKDLTVSFKNVLTGLFQYNFLSSMGPKYHADSD